MNNQNTAVPNTMKKESQYVKPLPYDPAVEAVKASLLMTEPTQTQVPSLGITTAKVNVPT